MTGCNDVNEREQNTHDEFEIRIKTHDEFKIRIKAHDANV